MQRSSYLPKFHPQSPGALQYVSLLHLFDLKTTSSRYICLALESLNTRGCHHMRIISDWVDPLRVRLAQLFTRRVFVLQV